MQMYDEDLIKYLENDKNNYNNARMQFEFSNVLAGMRIPGIENKVLEQPVSKNDIKPTLANICNLKDTFSMGTNMFSRNSYVAINNGKVVTKDYFYDGTGWFKLLNGEQIDFSTISEEEKNKLNKYQKDAIEEIDISNSFVIKNLLQNHLKELKDIDNKDE